MSVPQGPFFLLRRYQALLAVAVGLAVGALTGSGRSDVATMPNTIYVIAPYAHSGTWVFDDERVGLLAEPFISGVPAMIDRLVADIPNARSGFRLLFSQEPFPGYQAQLRHVRGEYGGHWYRWEAHAMEGWLCPALFKYFPEAPPTLYAKAELL